MLQLREVSIQHAEKFAGRRLDRRRKYAIGPSDLFGDVDGKETLCELVRWTRACSGCSPDGEFSHGASKGSGCEDCGYTGKRREAMWIPVELIAAGRGEG